MIRRDNYSSNNFQDSNKRKSTESKILGYLPRVLFFNAFEIDAESANQVIESKSNFFLFIGKCSILFLSGN
jgi:hypothetical protein